MRYNLQFRDVFAAWDLFVSGVWLTLVLSLVGILGGLIVGTASAAAQVYGGKKVRLLSAAYVEVIRNTPLIVQLFLVFYGLASIGLRMSGLTAGIITLVVNLGAYTTEIVRAGLEAVPSNQTEAGSSLGLSRFQVFRHIVLLPAMKAMFPALSSQFVFFILSTSVISQIAVPDLFYVASLVQSKTYRDFEVYLLVAALYLGLALLFRGLFSLIYVAAFRRWR